MNPLVDRVLVVEDAALLSMLYETVLGRCGHRAAVAATLAEARALLARERFGLVLLDLQLPDGDGMDLLRELHARSPDTRVIVITANGSINRAVGAMRAGAFDFLVKPFDEARLMTAIRNAVSVAPCPSDARKAGLDHEPEQAGAFGFIGRSEAMRGIYRIVRSIGRSTATVFITGESGTGKEVCARAIHSVSSRAHKAFVPLNCAAIPHDLLESEVFGHLRGSFTGALADKPGAAAIADGGTLFLDEVCEMDLSLQTKLLRFLQTGTIHPVGAPRPVPVDVRIVCATNRDPLEEVRAGRFREDLYYRLHVVPIHMPPLRERPDDIMDIAQAILARDAHLEGKAFAAFHPDAAALLRARPWPGNVRQLLNVIRNIVVLNDGPVVLPEMIPVETRPASQVAGLAANQPCPPTGKAPGAAERSLYKQIDALVGTSLADVERLLIEATIARCDGSIPRAAKLLALAPSTVYRKLEAWSGSSRRA